MTTRQQARSGYPHAPESWALVDRRSAGPFLTGATFRRPDGRLVDWSSRRHRKHASLLSRVRRGREHVLWAPHRVSWWIAVLFVVGSACFTFGPMPWFLDLVGEHPDALVFFVGSLFFTSAAFLQWLETVNADVGPATPRRRRFRLASWEPTRVDWWSTGVQLVGTLFFNATTFRALSTATTAPEYDKVVWRPDLYGSICFLVSGYLAYVEVTHGLSRRPPATLEGWIVSVNFFGCLAFGVSAVAAYVVPTTGSAVDVAVANATTAVGGLAFLVGAVLLLPEGARDEGVDAEA